MIKTQPTRKQRAESHEAAYRTFKRAAFTAWRMKDMKRMLEMEEMAAWHRGMADRLSIA